tara:strand:+ start:4853 stop:5596 length:744 start_codon:yes stop_codon:yes gene_type:complete
MISVVVPTYNPDLNFLVVLESILKNLDPYPKSEIIVVDDGSFKSESKKIFEKVNSFEKVFLFTKPNGGVSSARNYGVNFSKNNLIAFCDSDDIWIDDKIQIQIKTLLKYNLKCIGSQKRFSKKPDKLFFLKVIDQMISWGPHVSSVIIYKEFFLSINGFDEKMTHAEDGDFYLKVIKSIGSFPIINSTMIRNVEEKIAYGIKGLSANLKLMLIGEVNAIKKNLNYLYWIFIIWIYLKYLKRILITKF